MLGNILFLSLVGVTSAGFGPLALYNALEGNTYTFSEYAISPYSSVYNSNISYGDFDTYVVENNMYSYQRYTSGSSVGCSSPRTMKLFIACGSTSSLGPVSEPSPCSYQSVLEMPQACGVSFAVGSEYASPSPAPSANATVVVIPPSSIDGYVGMILGALGVTGVGAIIAMQVFKAIKNKGGLTAALKANSAKIDEVMAKIPVPDSVKQGLKSAAEKQIERIDVELDKKLKTTRSKLAMLEGRKYVEDSELDIRPPLRHKPSEPVIRNKSPAQEPKVKVEVRSPTPDVELTVNAKHVVDLDKEPPKPAPIVEEEVKVCVPEAPTTAKLEVSAADLEEIKALLMRRNKQFAVAE